MLTVTSLILMVLGAVTTYGVMVGNFVYITLGVTLSVILLLLTLKSDVDEHERRKWN